MKRIHILGRKNHGKTTLVAELVAILAARGLAVGTIKHTHHAHELDTPGKDSHRHRTAGACVAGILSPQLNAIFWPPEEQAATPVDRYEAFAPHFALCDLVIVEGDVLARGIKIEVWRKAAGGPPMAAEDREIAAVVTDDPLDAKTPVWPRNNPSAVADRILQLLRRPLRSPTLDGEG